MPSRKIRTGEPIKNQQTLQIALEIQQKDTAKKELNYNGKQGDVIIYQDAKIDSLTSKIGKKPFINGYTQFKLK